MGYGLGAAIGAKMARKDKLVFNIAGDGCFRMNMNEIATATRYNIPVIEVVVNNHVLGMVRQWQDLFYEKRYSATVLDDGVDFVKLAESYEAYGMRIEKEEDIKKAFEFAKEHTDAPTILEFMIDSDELVLPMVQGGQALDCMILDC